MEQPMITFVLNGKTFSLRAGDAEAIGAIPAAERQQLLALLEAVQRQEERARAIARKAVDKARMTSHGATAAAPAGSVMAGHDRLGGADVDALMARLVMEEERNRKPGLTRQGIYKWLLVAAIVIVLLVLLS
jgi:hypothetical protein